jgi:hypothetical protein
VAVATQELEVVGISHAIGALDGSPLYQVAFGTIGKPTNPPAALSVPQGANVAAVSVVVFVPANRSVSVYPMGSRWKLSLESGGRISLAPVKKKKKKARRSGGPS